MKKKWTDLGYLLKFYRTAVGLSEGQLAQRAEVEIEEVIMYEKTPQKLDGAVFNRITEALFSYKKEGPVDRFGATNWGFWDAYK